MIENFKNTDLTIDVTSRYHQYIVKFKGNIVLDIKKFKSDKYIGDNYVTIKTYDRFDRVTYILHIADDCRNQSEELIDYVSKEYTDISCKKMQYTNSDINLKVHQYDGTSDIILFNLHNEEVFESLLSNFIKRNKETFDFMIDLCSFMNYKYNTDIRFGIYIERLMGISIFNIEKEEETNEKF